ncbi:hypothetical protein TVAG_174230 [Trichomonas vaginalis G3]|uniref:Uncharacterized protein n=1 Tax=Trichomonas vaginalis (strain ATCC PRA-98 / G3) TaxID=412133 RepID=A2EWW6_TRIV3|nr:hypothetical protein TVAGG3_0813700 [Trichomonas vaginalis G3]EAY02881.1 hypothetical protein TVAG_174230 [Trichomonas vaginalis G3]KAI5497395.1 hypothetical protein TVAGG3_0813700 [Trichomonas vaginalis G3]|eukprot:XP_001315104.1 hypothetical protein [Trichomonas vaginalis G3]
MNLNTDDALLSRVSSLSSSMQPRVQIAYERAPTLGDSLRSLSVPRLDVEMKDSKPETMAKISSPRGLTAIPSNLQAFFLILKPDSRKKLQKQYFLFSPTYSILVDEDVKRMEVLPESAKYYIDQKRFYIYIGTDQRKFILEVKREMLDMVFKNSHKSSLESFFLSYLANGKVPPNTNLAAGYFSKVIFNKTFLIYYYMIPEKYFTNAIINAWCVASQSNFDYIFTQILRHHFSQNPKSDLGFGPSSFIFNVIYVYLTHDDDFNKFLQLFDHPCGNSVEFYLENVVQLKMNIYSHLTMFILYHELSNKYDSEFAKQTLCRIIYNTCIRSILSPKSSCNIDLIDKLLEFGDNTTETQKSVLYESISKICQQPTDFCPKRTNMMIFAAYSSLLEKITSNNIDFLSIIRKMEKDLSM